MLLTATLLLLGLMFLMWGAAVWATFRDEEHESVSSSQQEPLQKAA